MSTVLQPPLSRRLPILAGALLAPMTLILLYLLRSIGYLAAPEHLSKFFPGLFVWAILMSYIAFALVGGTASLLRFLLRAPLRAGVVVSLFALSAAPWGLLVTGDWSTRLLFAAVCAFLSLPVSLTYCAIAGVRWRAD